MAKLRKWSNVLAMKNQYGARSNPFGSSSDSKRSGGNNVGSSSGSDSLGYGYGGTKGATRGRKTPSPAPAPPRRRR